jgi:flagellar basal body-associated protein FliL
MDAPGKARGPLDDRPLNKKLIIFGALALLLLAGGGGGGMFAMGMFDSPDPAGEEEAAAAEPGKGKGKNKDKDKDKDKAKSEEESEEIEVAAADPGASYIKMKPVTGPVFRKNRIAFNVMLSFSLELTDTDVRDDVARMMPRLRDAMVRDLYANGVTRNDGSDRFDLEAVKRRMLRVATQTIPGGLISDVLITSVIRIN